MTEETRKSNILDILNDRESIINAICDLWGAVLDRLPAISDADRAKGDALRGAIAKFDSSHRQNLTELMSILTGINLKESEYRAGDFVTILNKEGNHNYDVDSVVRLASCGSDGRWQGYKKVSSDGGDNLKLSNMRHSTPEEVHVLLTDPNRSSQLNIRDLTTILTNIDRRG